MAPHLQKVLKHAEEKLMTFSGDRATDQLDLYQNFFKIEEHRLFLAHRAGEGGESLARKRSDLYSVVLTHVFEGALKNGLAPQPARQERSAMAMLAVGGFGRGQLCPHSDIDLLFLYQGGKQNSRQGGFVHDVVEQVLYLLWDIGLKVGHAARTVDEAVSQGKEDYQTLTAYLDARLLAGCSSLVDSFQEKFRKSCLVSEREKYLRWRLEDQRQRHEKYNGTVFVQEPHIKNGCGGLRDYQNLMWVAEVAKDQGSLNALQKAGWIKAPQRKKLRQAHDFLMRVRNQLHYDSKRPADLLTLRAQGEVATGLGYRQRSMLRRTEALMKDYYGHSRELFHGCNLLARRLAGEGESRDRGFVGWFPTVLKKQQKIHGFTLEDGWLKVPSTKFFSAEPRRIVRAFQIMQQHAVHLHPDTESRIRNRARLLTPNELRSHNEYAEMLFHILGQKGNVGWVVRKMHQTNVLGRLVPEFAPLTCLVQHEFYHRYTADEHTIVCLEQLDKVVDSEEPPYRNYRHLLAECMNPEILYLALILHDVGKADNTGHHEAASVQKAVTFARRMRLRRNELQLLTFLVDHHGSLNMFACRRNLEDPKTIRDFARLVQSRERLRLLMLVSFADTQGTGDQSWSNWKEGLVWHLFRLTDSMLTDEEEFRRQQEDEQQKVKASVIKALSKEMSPEEAEAHFAVLPENFLNFRNEALVLQQMTVAHRFISKQITDEEDEDLLFPEIHWENRPTVDCSEVSIATWDRDQLFTKICGAFTLTGLIIISADILTRGDDIVIDTFRVTTEQLTAASHRRDRIQFTEYLQKCLFDPDFDLSGQIHQHARARQVKIVDHDILEPALGIDNESSDRHTVLHVRASDRMGLLYVIADCISRHGIGIANARISTEKGAALDAFYLQVQGKKLTDRQQQVTLLKDLNRTIVDFIS